MRSRVFVTGNATRSTRNANQGLDSSLADARMSPRAAHDDGEGIDVEEQERVVVVTGATGRIGGAVAHHLLCDGWAVRAVTRNPSTQAARALAAEGAEVVAADFDDRASLDGVMRGASGVFSIQNPMTSGVDAEVRHGKTVADAAQDSGVAHVVYGSAGLGITGTGVGSWDSKLEVQAHMEQLGLPLTVLRPMALMELMTDKAFYPPVSTWHVMPKLMGADRPVGWICADDVGAIAAGAFADPDRFVGLDLALVADVKTIAECRSIWREVTGRPPRRFPMPVRLFERIVGTDLTTMWRWLRSATFDLDPSSTHDLLPAARDVREWLTARLAA